MASPHRIEPAHIERFRAFVARWLGFETGDEKLWSLTEVLRRRVREKSCDAETYLTDLENAHPFCDELRTLAHELTVNETSFFRNADQMAAFSEVAVPECLAKQPRKLRILSAGCASGEEAYSLAMILRNLPLAADCDIEITGIDADTSVLKKADAARYSAWSLRQTPAAYRADFFRTEKNEFVLCDAIRKMVALEERNLTLDDPAFWAPDSFDIVFCRNVIMYFTQDVARAVIARIARSLRPGGFLFLGVAETLRGLSSAFHLTHTHGTFYYKRRDETRALPDSESSDVKDDHTGAKDFVEAIDDATRRIRSLKPRTKRAARTVKRKPIDLDAVVELFRCERVSEAVSLLDELPAALRQDSEVLLLRAMLLTHGGDLAEAEQICTELLSRSEDNAGAHYLMALCKESAGDHAAALKSDQTAVRLDPGFAMPHLHVGLLARRAGDWDAARRELSKAATLIPGENNSRLLLFGGGFNREALSGLCRAQLNACGGRP
jgi:chemotaxis protein methyltransferase CheR